MPGCLSAASSSGMDLTKPMTQRLFVIVLVVLHAPCLVWGAGGGTVGDSGFVISADQMNAAETEAGRVVFLEGNVTVEHEGASLWGRRGRYHERDRLAVICGDVHGVEGAAEVAGDTLRYYRDASLAILTGNASFADSAGVIRARRIELYRREGIAVALGDVVAIDEAASSRVVGDRLVYDIERREARVVGSPVLTAYEDDGSVDMVVRGRVLEFHPEDKLIAALSDVVIVDDEMEARSRWAILHGGTGFLVLTGGAVVEKGVDRLSGEMMEVETAEGEVTSILGTGRARIDYVMEGEAGPRTVEEYGHVLGDTLVTFFEDADPSLTIVRGNAESEHFVGDTGERNLARSGRIDIRFSGGRITRTTFRGNAAGEYVFAPEEGESSADGSPTRAAGGGNPQEGIEPAGQDTVILEVVRYAADQIDYYVGRNRIVLSGAAHVEHKTSILNAARVEFDPGEEVLYAEGTPELLDESDRLVGRALSYDMRNRTGVVADGVTTFEDGLYYGDRIVRLSEGTLNVSRGIYTTCWSVEPDYKLVSHRMKVYLNDKVIAKPVILYIGEIPVFALPFYIFPIRKQRHSGFLIPRIELGITEGRGQFIRNFGYYWAPNDYWDLSAWADYYEQTRWVVHGEARYKLRYVLSGSVDGSFTEELVSSRRRWDLHVRHRQEFGRHWSAGLSGDFRSDAAYATDTHQTIEESVNRSLHSQLWGSGRWSGFSAGITFDRKEELDRGTVSQLLPKVDLRLSQRPLVESAVGAPGFGAFLGSISYSLSATGVNDRDRAGADTDVHQAVGVDATFRSSNKLLRWLNLSPRLSLSQDWYDRDKLGRRFPGRFTYSAGVSTGTALYGTFFPMIGPLEAVRHIVEPSASFSWAPEFKDYFDSQSDIFYTFSGFGSTPRDKKVVSVSLVNKLQVKLRRGERIEKIDDLLRLTTSTSYDFKREERRWADLDSRLELRPRRGFSMRWNARHDPYDWTLLGTSVTTTISLSGESPPATQGSWEDRVGSDRHSPAEDMRRELAARMAGSGPGGRPWDSSLTFRYSRGATPDDSSYWVDGKLALSLTPKWRVNYSLHYDLKEREVASQEYAVLRDMHCWEAEFVRRYYGEEWEYYFRIAVKSLPEIRAETGKKYLERAVR